MSPFFDSRRSSILANSITSTALTLLAGQLARKKLSAEVLAWLSIRRKVKIMVIQSR